MEANKNRHCTTNDWINLNFNTPIAVGDFGVIANGKFQKEGKLRFEESSVIQISGSFMEVTQGINLDYEGKVESGGSVPHTPLQLGGKISFRVTNDSGIYLRTSEQTNVQILPIESKSLLANQLRQIQMDRGMNELVAITQTIIAEEATLVIASGKGSCFSISQETAVPSLAKSELNLKVEKISNGIETYRGKQKVVVFKVVTVEKNMKVSSSVVHETPVPESEEIVVFPITNDQCQFILSDSNKVN